MDNTYANSQFIFIRCVEQYVGVELFEEAADRRLIKDIAIGAFKTYQDAADRYTKGDITHIRSQVDSIISEYTKFLLDTDVYHNDVQRLTSHAITSWAIIRKMLNLGHQEGAIEIAYDTFDLAVSCQAFGVATGVASALSVYTAQVLKDLKKADKWQEERQYYGDQHEIVDDSKYRFARMVAIISDNKICNDEILALIKTVLLELAEHKDSAESHVYWHAYFQTKTFYYEIKGDYDTLLKVGIEGYEYFDALPLNHSNAKATMLASVVHAYNLMHRYDETIHYLNYTTGDGRLNDDLLSLRLARTSINLKDVSTSLKLLDQIQKHRDVLSSVNLYRSYCSMECYRAGLHDRRGKTIAYLILDLYRDAQIGKTDRHSHDHLMNFIRKNDFVDTREALIMEVLSLLRYRFEDLEKYRQIDDLVQVMRFAPSKSTECEVLRYETMIEELLEK